MGWTMPPWVVSVGEESGEYFTPIYKYAEGVKEAYGEHRWIVRFDDDYGTDQWADAHLISAAPELLAALSLARSMILSGEKMTDRARETIEGALNKAMDREI